MNIRLCRTAITDPMSKLSLVYFGKIPCASRAVIITVICCSYLSNFVLLSVMLWYSRPKGIDWKGLGGFWAKLVIWQLKITLSNQYWRGAHHVKKRAVPCRATCLPRWGGNALWWIGSILSSFSVTTSRLQWKNVCCEGRCKVIVNLSNYMECDYGWNGNIFHLSSCPQSQSNYS